MDDFLDLAAILAILFLALCALAGGVSVASHFYGQYQCGKYQEITGKETRWSAFDICYIKTDAGWQRWDEYQNRGRAAEGLKAIAK